MNRFFIILILSVFPSFVMAKSYLFVFKLHGQTRRYPIEMMWKSDTLNVTCQKACYKMTREAVAHATGFSWQQPIEGTDVILQNETFGILSCEAFIKLRDTGNLEYGGLMWRLQKDSSSAALHAKADVDDTEMWISTIDELPVIIEMKNNPLGIDWKIE